MFTSPSDTLVIDSAKLSVWRQDSDYDYGRELVPHQNTFGEWLQDRLSDFTDEIFRNVFAQNREWMWTVLGIIVILAILWIVFVVRPSVFMRSGKKDDALDYDVTEDTIYGIDFPSEIEKALDRHDYREALRLMYLQTLKWLSDNHQIDWQSFKTPTQYTNEWRNADFQKITLIFVKVRYGGFEATEKMIAEMRVCQEAVRRAILQGEKGGDHEE